MWNPLNTIRKFQSRIGKPVRPIIECQKGGSIVNIVTNTVQDGNMISDTYRAEAWELHPEIAASAIYVDGIFKGMGYFVGEEGHALKATGDTLKAAGQVMQIEKNVELYNEVLDIHHDPVMMPDPDHPTELIPKVKRVFNLSYKGLNGKYLDANIIERGSALKPSLMQTIIYCAFTAITFLLIGMSWK